MDTLQLLTVAHALLRIFICSFLVATLSWPVPLWSEAYPRNIECKVK